MADKKISELDSALLINNDAVFPMSQDNAGEPTTFKVGITQLGTEIAEDMTFSNLQTTSKKLVGAINELLSLGSPIIIGTTAPTSSQGANGNLYIQYTAGTGGADDEVDGIFIKINGAWCEIQTGGGGAGGHTIVDDAGTDLAQRTNLQFLGAYSEDNSTDDTTEVNVVRSMTKAEFNQLSADEKVGFINITDEEGQITADNLPISSSDPTNTKDYIDTALSGKEDSISYESDDYNVATYGGVIRCKKWGRVVNIQGYGLGTVTNMSTVQAYTMATIASKYRPITQQHIIGTMNAGSYATGSAQGYRINTDGTIVTYVYNGTKIENGYFNVTYIV